MDLGRFETSLAVADIVRSLAFYKALGFRQTDGDIEIRNVTLRRGDCRLSLFQGYLEPPRTQLIFWQGRVLANARALIAKGLAFDEGHPRSAEDGGASGMLRDPDGHPIYLIYMPFFFVNDPAHTRKAPSYRPSLLKPDRRLGWYELNLASADLERTRAFYEAMGFRVAVRDEASITLQNRDCRIVFRQDKASPGDTRMVFRQGDIAAIAGDLARAGLRFERSSGALSLKDPDGHFVIFSHEPGVERAEPA
jgi:catechol 2,3-dioxygenase-like lactoylglutathione lyase family enzyme